MKIAVALELAGLAAAISCDLLTPRTYIQELEKRGSNEPFIEVTIQPAPAVSVSEQVLIDFAKMAGLQIFPDHTDWEQAFDKYIDPSVVATFTTPLSGTALPPPDTKLNFTTFKAIFTEIFVAIASNLNSLEINFVDVVAFPYPNTTMTGLVYLTGYEHGVLKNGSATPGYRDGLFVEIKNGKFIEWREASNFYVSLL